MTGPSQSVKRRLPRGAARYCQFARPMPSDRGLCDVPGQARGSYRRRACPSTADRLAALRHTHATDLDGRTATELSPREPASAAQSIQGTDREPSPNARGAGCPIGEDDHAVGRATRGLSGCAPLAVTYLAGPFAASAGTLGQDCVGDVNLARRVDPRRGRAARHRLAPRDARHQRPPRNRQVAGGRRDGRHRAAAVGTPRRARDISAFVRRRG